MEDINHAQHTSSKSWVVRTNSSTALIIFLVFSRLSLICLPCDVHTLRCSRWREGSIKIWMSVHEKERRKQKKGCSFSVLLVTETPSNCYLMVNQPETYAARRQKRNASAVTNIFSYQKCIWNGGEEINCICWSHHSFPVLLFKNVISPIFMYYFEILCKNYNFILN